MHQPQTSEQEAEDKARVVPIFCECEPAPDRADTEPTHFYLFAPSKSDKLIIACTKCAGAITIHLQEPI